MAQTMADDGGRVPMSPGLQATLLRAREYAASQSEAEVLLEHLLLALSEDADAATVLEACRIDLSRLRRDVAGYIGSLDDRVPAGTPGSPAISAALTQVLKYATLAAQQGRRTSIDGAIVLAALVGDGRSMAASFLKAQGLTFEAAIRALREVAARALPPTYQSPPAAAPEPHAAQAMAPPGASRTENILAQARERVESRSPRPEVQNRQPRAERAPAEPTLADAAPSSEPLDAASLASGPAAAPPVPTSGAAHASGLPSVAFPTAAAQAQPPIPAPVAPPPSGRIEPNVAGPTGDGLASLAAPDAAGGPHAIEPPLPSQVPSPRPVPPQLPRADAPKPPEAGDVSLYPENRIAAPPRRPPASAGQSADPPSLPAPGVAHSGRYPHAAHGQPPGAGSTDPAPQRPQWPPGGRPPWPETPQPGRPPTQQPAVAPPGARPGAAAPALEPGMVSHSIPTRLKRGQTQIIEVRIDRPALAAVGGPPRSYALRPEAVVARAITVRLRAAAGDLMIDAGSPETQWDQAATSGQGRLSSEAAIWRFHVTPLGSGRAILQLGVSARTLGADGVLAETRLPEQGFDVRVTQAYGSLFGRIALMGFIAVASMVALKVAEGFLGLDLAALVRRMLGS